MPPQAATTPLIDVLVRVSSRPAPLEPARPGTASGVDVEHLPRGQPGVAASTLPSTRPRRVSARTGRRHIFPGRARPAVTVGAGAHTRGTVRTARGSAAGTLYAGRVADTRHIVSRPPPPCRVRSFPVRAARSGGPPPPWPRGYLLSALGSRHLARPPRPSPPCGLVGCARAWHRP